MSMIFCEGLSFWLYSNKLFINIYSTHTHIFRKSFIKKSSVKCTHTITLNPEFYGFANRPIYHKLHSRESQLVMGLQLKLTASSSKSYCLVYFEGLFLSFEELKIHVRSPLWTLVAVGQLQQSWLNSET